MTRHQRDKEHAAKHAEYRRRDAETLVALGAFIIVLAIPVLLGAFWAGTARAASVTIAAGGALLAIGGGMAWRGWKRRPGP